MGELAMGLIITNFVGVVLAMRSTMKNFLVTHEAAVDSSLCCENICRDEFS
jgi:hypothetical protein